MAKLLTEYQAAAQTGMSPELLRWLAKFAPKQGDPRKLKIAKQERELVFFDEAELETFNAWLRMPWPHKEGKRPPVPKGIREEIRREANGECAICNHHMQTCEAAHLDPVASGKNNHPENLLWLCANHHTAYDDGLFGPKPDDAEFVKHYKVVFHRYKKMLWERQDELSRKLFLILDNVTRIAEQSEQSKTAEQRDAISRLAEKTLAQLPALGPVSHTDPHYPAYKKIETSLSSLSESEQSTPLSVRLTRVKQIRNEYVAALGYVECPLCIGSGIYDDFDCPICNADGEIDEELAEQVDLTEYEVVECPLCEGIGRFDGDDCPECGGRGKMLRRYADQVDLRQYENVECPLCNGKGRFDGDDCPECGGGGKMLRRFADQVDVSQYENVECPLCDGKGRFDGDDCPECGGRGKMLRRFADQVDVSQYENVECPLCDGKGRFDGDDCPECGGRGKMLRRFADQVDVSQYENVECPLCDGKGKFDGDDCPECGGQGEMPRRYADQADLSQYEKVQCPLCDGKGRFDGDDCPECGGQGEMSRRYADQSDLSQYEKVQCPACDGRGQVNGNDCGFCDGEKSVIRRMLDNFDPNR